MTTMFSKYVLFSFAHFIAVYFAFKILCLIAPEFLKCYYTNIVRLATVLLISKFTFQFTKQNFLNQKIHPDKCAVLITGCDTGFGHHLAKRLDSRGFHVFASCLYPNGEGAQELEKMCTKRLQVLGLDVGKDESVANAVTFVNENLGSSKLWAIVNNAGIQKGYSLDYSSIQDFQDCLNVNSIGTVRVTKAFLPLLRKSKGRVVNVTSMVGRGCCPLALAYFASKFAAVGFNSCLRQELAMWGISVVSVEPEFFQTEFSNKEKVLSHLTNTIQSTGSDIRKEHGETFEKKLHSFAILFLKLASPKVEKVVDDLEAAVTAVHPDVTYRPRRNALSRFIIFFFCSVPENIQDIFVKFVLYLYGFYKSLNK